MANLYPIAASGDGQRVTKIGNSGTTKGRKKAASKDPSYYGPKQPPPSLVQRHKAATDSYERAKAQFPQGHPTRVAAARRLGAVRTRMSGYSGKKAIGRPAHLSHSDTSLDLVRHVRSARGVEFYGLPMGSPIVPGAKKLKGTVQNAKPGDIDKSIANLRARGVPVNDMRGRQYVSGGSEKVPPLSTPSGHAVVRGSRTDSPARRAQEAAATPTADQLAGLNTAKYDEFGQLRKGYVDPKVAAAKRKARKAARAKRTAATQNIQQRATQQLFHEQQRQAALAQQRRLRRSS